jgi:hypothetical protein
MQRTYEVVVECCERCEQKHEGVMFQMFELQIAERDGPTHYGFCLTTAEPMFRDYREA